MLRRRNRPLFVFIVPGAAAIVVAAGAWLLRTSAWGATAMHGRIAWFQAFLVAGCALAVTAAVLAFAVRRLRAERRAADAERDVVRTRLDASVKYAPIALIEGDVHGRILAIEGRGIEPAGEDASELIGETVFDVYRAHPQVVEDFRFCLGGNTVSTLLETRDRIVEITSKPRCDADGRVFGFIAVATDVTRRRQSERDLEKSRGSLRRIEDELTRVRDEAPVGIAVFNEQARLTDANQAFCAMFGYGEDELRGMSSDDLTHPDDIGRSIELNLRLMHGTETRARIEKRFVRKDGAVFEADTRLTLVRGRQGEATKLIAMVEDVTARKRTRADLIAEAARLAGVLEVATDGLILLDAGGRVVSASPRATELTGIDMNAIRGSRVADFAHRLEGCGPEPKGAFARLFAGTEVEEFAVSVQWPKRRRLALEAKALAGGDGTAAGTLVILREQAGAAAVHGVTQLERVRAG